MSTSSARPSSPINSEMTHAVGSPFPHSDEEVLSLDIYDDFSYRIRRQRRVVYVCVLDRELLPPDWDEQWDTLTVRRGPSGIECTPDEFVPHGLDLERPDLPVAPFYNLLDLTWVNRIGETLWEVEYGQKSWIMKVARFDYELRFIQPEVSVYAALAASRFPMAPKFVGFVYEESKARTIGFLLEKLDGVTPGIQNLAECRETVQLLHRHGIVHGALLKYNFLITDNGAMLFDYGVSTVVGEVDPVVGEQELTSLETQLKSTSTLGRK
ncbi:hypothetical protein BO70DRAFT_393868 [Aspergillus heteromorphus CBS 117.55]|uniref:Protein kinase domain-containing protein n=1 Tax=Aspergillus heteromorphus CBS 117.55 TaxID=1448321 RepID=A0A317WQ23_9EURO|nr:uncharacterized protein BO70DRAFT_393868 [Aspergillus heteromorphus CBS 117.55]PWY88145.1 hypothetical protein BO70DRAFT_393868 [Aspergillus heteromorphus CBS 117.55]